MLRALSFDVRALIYGPTGPDFLSEVLRGEAIAAEPADVAGALERLPQGLRTARSAMRTEEEENDYSRAMLPLLLENLGVRFPTDALLLRLLEAVHEYHAYDSMYPETLPVLEELRSRGLLLAVVANWEPSLHRLVREFELDEYFRLIVSSAEVGLSKPDPYIFHQALKQMNVPPEAALHVGPSLQEDVAGALRAGIRPVWLNRTGLPVDFEVLTITDLRGLLLLAGKAEV